MAAHSPGGGRKPHESSPGYKKGSALEGRVFFIGTGIPQMKLQEIPINIYSSVPGSRLYHQIHPADCPGQRHIHHGGTHSS